MGLEREPQISRLEDSVSKLEMNNGVDEYVYGKGMVCRSRTIFIERSKTTTTTTKIIYK